MHVLNNSYAFLNSCKPHSMNTAAMPFLSLKIVSSRLLAVYVGKEGPAVFRNDSTPVSELIRYITYVASQTAYM